MPNIKMTMGGMRDIVAFFCLEQEIPCPKFRTRAAILEFIETENIDMEVWWKRLWDYRHDKRIYPGLAP